MCGIAGAGGPALRVEPHWIKQMTETLKHRGPDDEGYLALNSRERIAVHLTGKDSRVSGPSLDTFNRPVDFLLGHRRLSILDPSPSGHQPMSNGDQTLWLVYNGEIYNYLELRKELQTLGHRFHTRTDTEVVLAAYEQWGKDCLNYFNGMWALVIYDKRKDILFGARDRFGVKPLYFYKDSGCFAFASEIKALLQLPFLKKTPNNEAVFDFFVFNELSFTSETFFKGIFEFPQSTAFEYHLLSGTLKKWQYYNLEFQNRWETFDEKKSNRYIEEIKELIFRAVKIRLRSDVPVGSCLSGGIDSSSVVGVVNRLIEKEAVHEVGDRQKVFTAVFNNKEIDETRWAKIVADRSKVQWFKILPKADEFLEDFPDLIHTLEIPYISPPASYTQYCVMKLVRQNNVKVLLDGQGGDELFTGYAVYYDVFFYELLKNLNFKTFKKELDGLVNSPVGKKRVTSSLLRFAARSITPYRLLNTYRMRQKLRRDYFNREFLEKHRERFHLVKIRDFKSLNNMLHKYFTRQNLSQLLNYEDKNSMRFSIESRTPFADDIDLIEYVFKIPAVYKIHEGWSKYLLREAMRDVIPGEIRTRKDKKGFTSPEKQWLSELKGNVAGLLTGELDEFVDIQGIKKDLEKGVETMSSEKVQTVWQVIGFSMWKKIFGV